MKIVYELYENVKIPIIGTGGISTGTDAIEYVMAGATACGIGSAAWQRGTNVFQKVTFEMEEWMKKNNYKKIEEIRGVAHE